MFLNHLEKNLLDFEIHVYVKNKNKHFQYQIYSHLKNLLKIN